MVTRSGNSRVDDLLKVECDVTSIKKLLLAVASLVFSALFGIGVWVGTNDTRLSKLSETLTKLTADVEAIEKRQIDTDILSAKIETRLISIDATLLEIKAAIK